LGVRVQGEGEADRCHHSWLFFAPHGKKEPQQKKKSTLLPQAGGYLPEQKCVVLAA
jgi:hypothetical protein